MFKKSFFSLSFVAILCILWVLGASSACTPPSPSESNTEPKTEIQQEIAKEIVPTEKNKELVSDSLVEPSPEEPQSNEAINDASEASPEPSTETTQEATQDAIHEASPEGSIDSTPEPTPETTQESVVEGACQTASDCPNDPPPIKCQGAHWECVSNRCAPTCGDPQSCDALERYIKEGIEKIQTCQEDVTCKMDVLGTCPFGCYLAKDWLSSDSEVKRLIDLYTTKKPSCQKCTYRCAPPQMMNVHCEHKKRCVVVSDATCNVIKDQQTCLQNAKCRAVIGPSCPQCADFGFQRCVPIESTGCPTQTVRARPSPAASACTTFASPCNVPHGWTLCP